MVTELSGPLVGRSAELEAIELALADPGGTILAISGSPGLGKSRLLRELELRAEAKGDLVLTGRGSELEAGVPYSVIVAALEDYLGALPARDFTRVVEGIEEDLAPALPAVGGGDDAGPHIDAERYRSHRALRKLLDRLAGRGRLVLLLDDLHWADAETGEFVGHLMRHPPAHALVAVAFRPAQLPAVLRREIEQSRHDGGCIHHELQPLTDAESDSLLGDGHPAAVRAALRRESGGNPFFLEQLARSESAISTTGGMLHRDLPEVPPAVLSAIGAELDALSPSERKLLSGGAVAGEPFEIDEGAAAAGMSAAESLAALDGLLAADLLRTGDAPRRFAFRHPLIRRAVYQSAGAGWCIAAHARLAAEMRRRGTAAARLAEHVMRSASTGDEEAIATLLEAATGAAPHAPASAARLFEAALELLPADAPPEQKLEAQVGLATSLGGAGRLEEARDTLMKVLRDLPQDQHQLRARAATFVARLDHALGRQGEARVLLERTLAELPEARSPEAGLLALELATDHLLSAEFEQMPPRLETARSIGRELEDPLLEAASLAGLAQATQNLRDIPTSLAAAAQAAAIVDGLDDDECAPLLETFWTLAAAEDTLERWDASVAHADRGIRLSRRFGVGFVFVALTHTLAVTLGWRGSLVRAREAAEETVNASHLSGNPASLAYAHTTECFVLTQAGEAEAAVRAGELAVEAARTLGSGLFVSLPHANLAAALLAAGEPDRARAQLLEAERRGALTHWVGRLWWEIWMCRAELGLGRVEEAERMVEAAALTAAEMGLDGRIGSALSARAAALMARGESEASAAVALDSIELLERAGRAPAAACVRIEAGRALADAGDEVRAIAEIERAHAVLIEADAPRLADEAAHELRRLGRRVTRGGTRGGADGRIAVLSGRELEVAHLVADGRTNREIGGALHLSEKTIANHLTRIFGKLDVPSRSALAAAVAREAGASSLLIE